MRFKIPTLILLLFTSFSLCCAQAADKEFKKNNPDIKKYEFSRSYLSALGYFQSINARWVKSPPKKKFGDDDLKVIRGTIEYLTFDSTDLRVAKNYMTKYLSSPNSLMKKVADMMIVTCDHDIGLNNQEKNLWQDWLNIKVRRKPKDDEEKNFIKAQAKVELRRKESDKNLVQASVMLTKVLLSSENADEKGHLLAINDDQRRKLTDILDSYGKDVLDWGLKPGQSTLQASIAVIREVLEDTIYISHK